MTDEITIPQYDHGFNLAISLQDHSGDIKDISGYTVTLKAWEQGTPGTVVVSTACTVVNSQSGTITAAISSGQFDSLKRYQAEIQTTMSGVRESFEPFVIRVRESPE